MENQQAEQSRLTWLIPVALIGMLGLLYLVWPAFEGFVDKAYHLLSREDRQGFEAWINSFGAWGPLAILAVMLLQTLLAVIPSVLIMVVSVLAYGPIWGGVLAWSGLLAAALMAYAIGRSLGPVTVDRLIGHGTEEKMEHFVDRYGVWAVVAARVSPVLSTDAVSLVAGLVRMDLLPFLAATAAGTLPLTILIGFLGTSIERMETGLIWVSVASLALFAAYVVYDRSRSAAHADQEA